MCGIFGLVTRPGRYSEAEVRAALNTITHRGPDDFGVLRLSAAGRDVWLCQRRLSIIDLSVKGHQPMEGRSRSGAHGWLVYNGEAYNFQELQAEMQHDWRFDSASDTEVLLAGLLTKGPDFLKRVNGMLALALFDANKQTLTLARDKLGKKPLYIYQDDETFAFSSELKPFRALDLSLTVNRTAMSYYEWLGYIPHDMTIYRECRKLPASSYLEFDVARAFEKDQRSVQYWDALTGFDAKFTGSYDEAIEEFLSLLDDATKLRLLADVPVGVFLSGGIDSSLVASSVQRIAPGQITAFSVKFAEAEFDESEVARDTAARLGMTLELLDLGGEELARQLEKIPVHYDEPFSDSSQIPTLAISEAARKHVSVVLTGDGGDEVFLGYPRYAFLLKLERMRKLLSAIPLARGAGRKVLGSRFGERLISGLLRANGANTRKVQSSVSRLKTILEADTIAEVYDSIMSVRPKREAFPGDAPGGQPHLFDLVRSWYPDNNWQALDGLPMQEQLGALDMLTFMRDDVLVKVDRASMAYSLEARSPLLDYRIIEFANSLPLAFKMQDGVHKRILRDALGKRLGGEITKLKKSGFDVPLPVRAEDGQDPQASWNSHVKGAWEASLVRP
jgi:asparagine synthase (glutamine-hydrolysing)